MAKSKPKKIEKKKVSPAKPSKSASKSTKNSTAKPVKKADKPGKKEKGPVNNKKASKPVAVKAKAKAPAAKPVPAKKAAIPAKGKAADKVPAKPLIALAKTPANPKKGADKPQAPPPPPVQKGGKGPKTKEKPVLSPELAALPKLPSNIHYKRTKQKLAPGEKRLVKTEVITHHVISDKPIDPEKKIKAEPKGKYQMEFIIRCPVTLLYDFLSTPSGLQEWFADDVLLKDDVYTFNWDGQLQKAQLLNAKIDNYLRFRWVDKPEGTYVEFRVNQDELTGEVSLVVTDFGDSEEDIITNRRLWETQIQRLIKVMGAY